MIQLLVGLGNPGDAYADTRHNVGVWLAEQVVQSAGAQLLAQSKFHGLYAKVTYQGRALHVLVPGIYMNESGRAVQAISQFYKIPLEATLVIHDDLDLACGDARLKKSGGHGGHNGLRSIIQHVGSQDFQRIRIGIGHPGHKDQVTNYVLHAPGKAERVEIEQSIERALAKLPDILVGNTQNLVKL